MLESSGLGVNEAAIVPIDLGLLHILLKDRTTDKISFGAQLTMLYSGKSMRLAEKFCRRLLPVSFLN